MISNKERKNTTTLTRWTNENELYNPIRKKLNNLGFYFEREYGYSDLVDKINRVLLEVKLGKDVADDGASQLLYEVVKNELKDFVYLGLADSELFHIFKTPEYGNILTFAKSLDSNLQSSPSSFSGKEIARAMVLLGEPIWQGFWKSTNDDISKILQGNSSIPFIKENLFDFHRIFGLYKINTPDIISAFTDFNVTNVEVTKNRIVITRSEGDPVSISYKGDMKLTHKWVLERLRIPNVKALEELRQTSDRLQSMEQRANRGAYYTEALISKTMGEKVLEYINPDFVIDLYAGAGSLLIPFLEKSYIKGWVNDYDEDAFHMLNADYGSHGYITTCEDIIDFPTQKACQMINESKNPLFITNPPFNSSMGKKIKNIDYGNLDKYGKGNQIYPTIGKIIEIMKQLKRGYLAFFSPLGIFCERQNHMKLLNGIINNFTFIDGYIWSGKHFNDVSGNKPVAFTIWKFGGSTNLETVQLDCENNKSVKFKRTLLLKDGWKYDNRNLMKNEIIVQHTETFNAPNPKIFHTSITKGGSEVIPTNVKIELKIDNIPSELIYALWSTVVGTRSIIGNPLYMDNAYVHMPNFDYQETLEILAYALIHSFIENDYTNGKIGFIGTRKIFKFGNNQRLNDGANYLFNTYGYLPIGNATINHVLHDIKNDKKSKEWKNEIRKEISNRLDTICYWNYIPLPIKPKIATLSD